MTDAMAIVTGAGGWLGSRLVRSLRHGLEDVPALASGSDRPIRCLLAPGEDRSLLLGIEDVEFVEGDLAKAGELDALFDGAQGAVVFHCAGMIHPRWRVRDFYRVNDLGCDNLLQAAQRAGVGRFIHQSSNSPVGVHTRDAASFDEESALRPYMHYGRSKLHGEEHVRRAASTGLHTVIVRAPWFYGPHQPARQTLFFRMIRDGKAPLLGDGLQRRSMTYVDNLCQGLMLCEAKAAAGSLYWIADEEPYTMAKIVDTVEAVLEEDFGIQVKHKRMHLPGFFGSLARVMDASLQAVGLYHSKIHVLGEMNKNISCSVDRAREDLGYRPAVALREGMRRSVAWCMEKDLFP